MNSSTTFTASNMKYHLLNLAAIASIVVAGGTAAQHLLHRQHPQAPSSFALMSSEIQQHDNECINDITMGYDECNNNEEEVDVTSSPSIAATTTQDVGGLAAHQRSRSRSTGASPEQLLEKTDEEINRLTLEMNHALRRRQEHERRIQALHGQLTPIKPGSIVELYSDTSYFAIPAIVLEGSSSSNNEYVIENTITHDTLPSVSSKLIHPYQIYADGTRASCNIGIEDTVYMTPCAVRSHVVREKSGLAMYEVSYLENDKLVEEYMPFSRVQRIHGRRNGMRGTAARSTSAQ